MPAKRLMSALLYISLYTAGKLHTLRQAARQ
jgi:hypothetical protein